MAHSAQSGLKGTPVRRNIGRADNRFAQTYRAMLAGPEQTITA
jgi:hypothetical protein